MWLFAMNKHQIVLFNKISLGISFSITETQVSKEPPLKLYSNMQKTTNTLVTACGQNNMLKKLGITSTSCVYMPL